MQITPAALRAINKSFRTLYDEGFATGPEFVNNFAMRTTATTAEGVYGWLGTLPSMREWLGDAVIQNLRTHDYKLPNKEFELTVGVDRVEIERDNLSIYSPYVSEIGTTAAQHPDELFFAAVVAGFTQTCYTGKTFFATNHEPVKGKLTFSNKGTKKLSVANYQTARTNLKSRRNPHGRPLNLGRDLVLLVSPANEAMGRQILISDKVNGGDDNVNKGTARLEVASWLSANEDMWFLFENGRKVKPFIHQVEKETQFHSMDDPNSAEVMLKKKFIHQAEGRYAVGYGLPELAYGSTGEDAP
jgi:phage major head subunit gpT-like protein